MLIKETTKSIILTSLTVRLDRSTPSNSTWAVAESHVYGQHCTDDYMVVTVVLSTDIAE